MPDPEVVIEPLGPHHDRQSFSCGEQALDNYLRQQASQDVRRRIAKVFVSRSEKPGAISGYFTLSAANFQRTDLPLDLSKRLPRYPIPAAILGRLAVSLDAQGKGLGGLLLLDAMRRVIMANEHLAVHALIVDAKHDRARAFYERYGFIRFPDTPMRLFIPLETIERIKF